VFSQKWRFGKYSGGWCVFGTSGRLASFGVESDYISTWIKSLKIDVFQIQIKKKPAIQEKREEQYSLARR
jgi:hypothetical protein